MAVKKYNVTKWYTEPRTSGMLWIILRVTWSARNFLTSWDTITFSRRTELLIITTKISTAITTINIIIFTIIMITTTYRINITASLLMTHFNFHEKHHQSYQQQFKFHSFGPRDCSISSKTFFDHSMFLLIFIQNPFFLVEHNIKLSWDKVLFSYSFQRVLTIYFGCPDFL